MESNTNNIQSLEDTMNRLDVALKNLDLLTETANNISKFTDYLKEFKINKESIVDKMIENRKLLDDKENLEEKVKEQAKQLEELKEENKHLKSLTESKSIPQSLTQSISEDTLKELIEQLKMFNGAVNKQQTLDSTEVLKLTESLNKVETILKDPDALMHRALHQRQEQRLDKKDKKTTLTGKDNPKFNSSKYASLGQIRLYLIQEKTPKEIAELTGMCLTTVYKRINLIKNEDGIK